MNRTINQLIFIVIIISFVLSYADQIYIIRSVIDGDTIMLGHLGLVRYIGIDSPEINYKTKKAAPFGFEAKEINKMLLSGRTIRIEYDIQKRDRFGRILAYVYTVDGTFINIEMIKRGYAWILFKRPNIKHHQELLVSQRYAMSNKLGIWSHWQEVDGITYIGNIKSKRFHRMDCPFGKQTSVANRIIFKKRWDAFYDGFSPCKQCILKQNG